MDLPPELRLPIYEELLGRREDLIYALFAGTSRGNRGRCDVAILRVCNQIYNEALPILYETNTFVITPCGKGPSIPNMGMIRRVVVAMVPGDLEEARMKQLHEARGLDWDRLHLWAIRANVPAGPRKKFEQAMEQDWLVQIVSEEQQFKMGLPNWWSAGGTAKQGYWFVKKGSTPLGHRTGAIS
jgi:hypothetical protein